MENLQVKKVTNPTTNQEENQKSSSTPPTEPEVGISLRANQSDIQTYLQTRLSDLEAYKEFKDGIDDFIKENLDEGTDYGKPYKGKGTKKTLLLPGAQKIARLLSLRVIMFADKETWEMLGSVDGIVCYSCYLVPYTHMGTVMSFVAELGKDEAEIICKMMCLAEGRGAGFIGNEQFRLKETALVKKTQKRAFVDAAIRIADLSDKFTQDMDDIEELDDFDTSTIGETTVKKAGLKEIDLIGLDDETREVDDTLGDAEVEEFYKPAPEPNGTSNPLTTGQAMLKGTADDIEDL